MVQGVRVCFKAPDTEHESPGNGNPAEVGLERLRVYFLDLCLSTSQIYMPLRISCGYTFSYQSRG